MDIKVEPQEDFKVKVTVDVDAKDVDSKVASIYKEFANKYNFPGFRKGKAPRPVIDNAFGKEAILAQATENVVNEAYPQVIESERIFPVGSPDFGDPGMVEPGKSFKFEFTQAVKPDYKLDSYDPVKIEIPSEDVSDAEVEEELGNLVERYETYDDAPEGAAIGKTECADLSIEATKEDGTPVIGLNSDTAFYAPGTGIYSDAFGKELSGMKAGDTKEFTLDVPEDEEAILMSDVAGQKISFKVECKAVKVASKPELTDEWVKDTLGFDGIDSLKEQIKDAITAQKADAIPRIKENECSMKLIERFNDEVPSDVLEQTESNLLQDFFTQLQRQGVSFDNYLMMNGIDSDQFKADVKKQAEDNAKKDLALDAWAKNAGIEATDEDVTLEFERSGVENPKELEEQWRKDGRLYLIREGIMRSKAMEDVMDKAQITEISLDDYLKKAKAE